MMVVVSPPCRCFWFCLTNAAAAVDSLCHPWDPSRTSPYSAVLVVGDVCLPDSSRLNRGSRQRCSCWRVTRDDDDDDRRENEGQDIIMIYHNMGRRVLLWFVVCVRCEESRKGAKEPFGVIARALPTTAFLSSSARGCTVMSSGPRGKAHASHAKRERRQERLPPVTDIYLLYNTLTVK